MKIGKQNKKNNNAPRGEFASIFDESPWERFTDRIKPLIKVLVVLAVIGGVGYGGFLLFGNKNNSTSNAAKDSTANAQADAQKQLAQCLVGVRSSNPVPEAGDADFYKKLIGGYDQQLGCYDKYPDADSAGRASIEGLRTGALDASGSYKDAYIASGGSYTYKSQTSNYTDPTTGCTITGNTSESDYIKCTDAYNAAHHTSVSTTPPVQYSAPTVTVPTNTKTTQDNSAVCATKKTSTNGLYDKYIAARNDVDAVNTQIAKIDETISQRYGGSALTETQRQSARASLLRDLQSQLSVKQTVLNSASQEYNAAKNDYIASGCY